MSNEGWIKISRKLLDWEWADDLNMMGIWLRLLLMANWEDKKWHGQIIKRGQLVTSMPSLSTENFTERQVRTALSRLEKCGAIKKEYTNKYSLITICNYEKYQICDTNTLIIETTPHVSQKSVKNNYECESYNDTNNIDVSQKSVRCQSDVSQMSATKEIKKERNKEEIQLTSNSNELSVNCSSVETPDPLDWDAFILFFNEKMRDKAIPPISKLTDKRKQNVKARMREYGKQAIGQVIINAAESDFLNGKNGKAWTAKFDWLFLPTNFPKVLEGNYKNKDNNVTGIIADRTGTYEERRRYDEQKRQEEYASLVNDILNNGT